jgi:hypothetical protein
VTAMTATTRLGVRHTLDAIPENGGPTDCGVPDVDDRSDVAGDESDRPRRIVCPAEPRGIY